MRLRLFLLILLVTPAHGEIRALWVDGFHAGFRTPQEVDQLVADAVAAHLNVLMVQVRRRGDSFYTHSLEPAAEDDAYSPSFDSLGYVIEKAHSAGLQVHAWVNVSPIWRGGPDPPKDPSHIFNVHGLNAVGENNWLTQTRDGERKFAVGYFLDPGHPAAAAHIVETILHIVKSYPVDGIHLDYVRYPETNAATESSGAPTGYNPVSVERFHRRYGGTGLPATNDVKWSAWRREQVTNLVRRIYFGIQEINPKVELSAALIPWGDGPKSRADWPHASPYWRVFQDWLGWIDAGIIDVAAPMNYSREDTARNRGYLAHWMNFERLIKRDRVMLIGLGGYMNTAAETERQMKRVRKPTDGWVIFSYFAPVREGPSLLAALAAHPGPTPRVPPRHASPDGFICGTIPASDGDVVEVSRKVGRTYAKPTRVNTDGSGFFGVARVRPGVYRVKSGERVDEVNVKAGSVARVF